MRGARVEPDVKRVAAGGERFGGGPAGRQFHAGEQLGGSGIEPEVGPMLLELVGDATNHAGVEVSLLSGIEERREGHAPRALAADAPVGPRLHGTADPGLAPGRHPLHLANRIERGLARAALVEGHEPLVDRAKNDGSLRTPAVRIAVGERLLREQGSGGGQLFQHPDIGGRGAFLGQVLDGLERRQPDEIGGDAAVIKEAAVIADRTVNLEAVFKTGVVVIESVAGSRVDATGAALGRDIIGKHDRRGAIDEGVARLKTYQSLTPNCARNVSRKLFGRLRSGSRKCRLKLGQCAGIMGHQIDLIAVSH